MAVDDAPPPPTSQPSARVVGTWSYSDVDDDDDEDEDEGRRRKKKSKGKAPQPQLPLPHEPAQEPRESYGSGFSVELVTKRDGGNPFVVGRLGNYVRIGNHTLDARCPLPPRDPTTSDINPLTGARWRPAELRTHPNGYYGLPANGREGVVDARQSRVAVADANDPKTLLLGGEGATLPAAFRRDLPPYYNDMSRVDLKEFWQNSPPRYRMPRNGDEFKKFEAARNRPGNWMAYQLWNRWVAQADTQTTGRTSAQYALLKHRKPRPRWTLEYSDPRSTTRRSLAERLNVGEGDDAPQDNVLPPAGTQNTTIPGQEEDVPMDNNQGTPQDSDVEHAPQDDSLPPPDTVGLSLISGTWTGASSCLSSSVAVRTGTDEAKRLFRGVLAHLLVLWLWWKSLKYVE
ncbi:hypothetical protein EIP86_000075 [Pleurotus ostreatoroseus]|nr:hypothetical protein EIP86_000075 [Pleurotus ostreatoroseus]